MEGAAAGTKAAHLARSEVIGLAIEQRLVTPYTAFVAVDSQPAVVDGKPLQTIYVAQPLPAGLELEGFLGGSGEAANGSCPPTAAGRGLF